MRIEKDPYKGYRIYLGDGKRGGYKANNLSLRGDKMKFKPTGKNGIDTSGERWRLAPDCSIGKCPACKLGRCIRIGDCLIKKD